MRVCQWCIRVWSVEWVLGTAGSKVTLLAMILVGQDCVCESVCV